MRAKVNGIRIACTDEGGGTPLLFIHGFPFNRTIWSKQVEAFKTRHRVIAPDLRGFGESEATPGSVPMGLFAEDLHDLLTYFDTGPVTLVGHSMGGYVALAFAKAFPSALGGLVLVGTRSGPDSPEAAAGRRTLAQRVRAEGVSVMAPAFGPRMLSSGDGDAALSAAVRASVGTLNPEGIIGALLGMAERPDAGSWLSRIQARTLVIAGAEDEVIPPSESEALAKAIPGARFVSIPDAGHLVAFERPDDFNEALESWLAGNATEGERHP